MHDAIERFEELQHKLERVSQTELFWSKGFEIEAAAQTATDAGGRLWGAQFGAFFYNGVNAAGESYFLNTLSGVDRSKFPNFPMPRNSAIDTPALDVTSIVRSGDVTPDSHDGLADPGMREGPLSLRSFLTILGKTPSGEVPGEFFYGHEKVDDFQQNPENLVTSVTAQASIAGENTWLRNQLQENLEKLERARQIQHDSSKRLGELAAIVTSSDDAILSKDLNGIITSWNQAATRILGYTSEEMIGAPILTIIPKHLQSDEVVILERIRSGQRIEHFETQRLTKSGHLLEVSLTVSPIRNDTGTIIGASKILRDISAKKRIEASLLQAEKIAAAGRMAATIAHEINNPLEAVINLLYLLRPSVKDQEGIDYLNAAESELTRVSHIARQTLGFYREHASASSTSLSDLVSHATTIYEPRCSSVGIRIERSITATRKIILRRGEMMQVISNLIANAIYAMTSGGTLRISVEDTEEGVLCRVEDDGIGIPENNLPHVFDAFFTTRNSIGTGIGLFIARQFVEGHGGSITIQSSTDPASHGTSVSVFLPLHTAYEDSSSDQDFRD